MNFSDIVKERYALHAAACTLVQFEGIGEDQRIPRASANVRTGYGIVRVDSVEQGLQRRRSEALRKNARTQRADHYSTCCESKDQPSRLHGDELKLPEC